MSRDCLVWLPHRDEVEGWKDAMANGAEWTAHGRAVAIHREWEPVVSELKRSVEAYCDAVFADLQHYADVAFSAAELAHRAAQHGPEIAGIAHGLHSGMLDDLVEARVGSWVPRPEMETLELSTNPLVRSARLREALRFAGPVGITGARVEITRNALDRALGPDKTTRRFIQRTGAAELRDALRAFDDARTALLDSPGAPQLYAAVRAQATFEAIRIAREPQSTRAVPEVSSLREPYQWLLQTVVLHEAYIAQTRALVRVNDLIELADRELEDRGATASDASRALAAELLGRDEGAAHARVAGMIECADGRLPDWAVDAIVALRSPRHQIGEVMRGDGPISGAARGIAAQIAAREAARFHGMSRTPAVDRSLVR